MAKRQKQANLLSILTKKARCEDKVEGSSPSDDENSVEQPDEGASSSHSNDKPQDHHMHHEGITSSSVIQQDKEEALKAQTACVAHCCSSDEKGFQPVDNPTGDIIATEKRNFQPQWYKQFPWLTICLTYKKVFCLYCRYATQHHLLSFSKIGGGGEGFH